MTTASSLCTDKLKQAYAEHLFPTPRDYWWREAGYSEPLLVQPQQEYFAAKSRIAFVGQQTNGWYPAVQANEIDALMAHYESFVRSSCRKWRFQQMAQDVAIRVNCDPLAITWTNLYRFDFANRAPDLPRAWRVSKRILGAELEALAPEHVVFAMGSNYTWELRDFLEEETGWEYQPHASGKRVLGTILQDGQIVGVHMVHPNARIKGPLSNFVREAVDALGIGSES